MEKYRVNVPEGIRGNFEVQRFTVNAKQSEIDRLRAIMSGRDRWVEPGNYTRLTRNKYIIMSDTDDEIKDLFHLRDNAKGDILIFGLGLGVAVQMAIEIDQVSSVTVVELEQDVIDLVGPHYLKKYSGKLQIIQGDARNWWPNDGVKYDVTWYDIWDDIDPNNLEEMYELYAMNDYSNWVGCWSEDLLRQRRGY